MKKEFENNLHELWLGYVAMCNKKGYTVGNEEEWKEKNKNFIEMNDHKKSNSKIIKQDKEDIKEVLDILEDNDSTNISVYQATVILGLKKDTIRLYITSGKLKGDYKMNIVDKESVEKFKNRKRKSKKTQLIKNAPGLTNKEVDKILDGSNSNDNNSETYLSKEEIDELLEPLPSDTLNVQEVFNKLSENDQKYFYFLIKAATYKSKGV